MNPLIVALKMDNLFFEFFNDLRKKHFPPERNHLDAHITLFHQLPNVESTHQMVREVASLFSQFPIKADRLMTFGAGVAYGISSNELVRLHSSLRDRFADVIIPQDKQKFIPHITIQNKAEPIAARTLMSYLSMNFKHIHGFGEGVLIYEYQGGPWKLVDEILFGAK